MLLAMSSRALSIVNAQVCFCKLFLKSKISQRQGGARGYEQWRAMCILCMYMSVCVCMYNDR